VHPTEADLSPDERRREIAAILAAGVLRLSARPEALPEHTSPGADDAPANSPDSAQKPLDLPAPPSPHVPAG
jgi:hypothetical protein